MPDASVLLCVVVPILGMSAALVALLYSAGEVRRWLARLARWEW